MSEPQKSQRIYRVRVFNGALTFPLYGPDVPYFDLTVSDDAGYEDFSSRLKNYGMRKTDGEYFCPAFIMSIRDVTPEPAGRSWLEALLALFK